jgi:triacylglycerol lipase
VFDSLARARRRLLTGLLAVVLVLVVAGAATLVVKALSGGGAAAQDSPGPIVLVPGYGGSTSDLDPLVARARQQGRQAVVFTPTDGGTGDLATQAKRLATLVDRTLSSSGAASVDLVGYSAGGVISRLYVRDDGGASVVRRVLTIGSPQHGTDLASIAQDAVGSCPKACEQLATDSDLVRSLNAGDETPKGPLWFTVRSSSDRTVVPTDTAELSGARNTLVQTACPDARTSHGDLPGDPVTLALFDAVVAKAEPGTLTFSC